jgi:prepilin-type N-terminal cleavage/methylation domain-containing protein
MTPGLPNKSERIINREHGLKMRKRNMRGISAKNRLSPGFTLVEIVIVLVVMGIIILAITPFLRVNLKSYVAVKKGKYNLEMARIGFNRMISEMRRIQGPLSIRFEDSSTMQFDAMFSRDGVISTKTITYAYDAAAGVVTRAEDPQGASTLVDNVSSFQLEYLDKAGNPISTESEIWRLRVSMTIGTGSEAAQFIQEIHPKIFQ